MGRELCLPLGCRREWHLFLLSFPAMFMRAQWRILILYARVSWINLWSVCDKPQKSGKWIIRAMAFGGGMCSLILPLPLSLNLCKVQGPLFPCVQIYFLSLCYPHEYIILRIGTILTFTHTILTHSSSFQSVSWEVLKWFGGSHRPFEKSGLPLLGSDLCWSTDSSGLLIPVSCVG